MPLFLGIRRSSKPTSSPQSQNTYFREQRTLSCLTYPHTSLKEMHTFPVLNPIKRKNNAVMFSRDAGCESGAYLQQERNTEKDQLLCAVFLICCCLLAPKKQTNPGPRCANIFSVCYLCQHKIISISFYSIILCQWQMNAQLCLTLVLLTRSSSSSALAFPSATPEFSTGLFATRWQNISGLG